MRRWRIALVMLCFALAAAAAGVLAVAPTLGHRTAFRDCAGVRSDLGASEWRSSWKRLCWWTRLVPGEDHPSTLMSQVISPLTCAGWGSDVAAVPDEDVLVRRRRVLGEEHPETQRSALNLAADLIAAEA